MAPRTAAITSQPLWAGGVRRVPFVAENLLAAAQTMLPAPDGSAIDGLDMIW